MEQSFRFFRNDKCIYLPCHEVKDIENFNCLFCYCPLYMMGDKCGGRFTMKSGIKDCSKCLIPHVPNGYDYINQKLTEYNMQKVEEFFSNEENCK